MTNDSILKKEIVSVIAGSSYDITLLANACAVLYQHLKQVNWVGFYLNKNGKLLLGPFQGKVACTEIAFSKGVCGTCAEKKETIVVDNVHDFPTHIACDSASNSEICIPILLNGQLYGLLDIDSPIVCRFTKEDQKILEEIVREITEELNKIVDVSKMNMI